MACANDGAAQAQPDRRAGSIELRIVDARRDDIFRPLRRMAAPAEGLRYEIAHQRTGDGGVAVGKMQLVGAAGVLVARGRDPMRGVDPLASFMPWKPGMP